MVTTEEGHGHRGHNGQVRSDGDRGERRGAKRGDRDAESEEWSIRSDDESDKETEEDRMPAGELEGREDMLTASPWGTQEIGAGGLRVDARAGGSDERKAPSMAANEAGKRGRHGARQGKGGHDGGRQEKVGAEPLGVGGNKGGHESSGVDPESHGVGEGGREASGVAENPGGGARSGQGSRVASGR